MSSSTLAAKSLAGSASADAPARIAAKLSVVDTSTIIRDGRSARAQTMPEEPDTSPDCTPCVTTGRSAARLTNGRAMPPAADKAADEPSVASSRRRLRMGMPKTSGPFA